MAANVFFRYDTWVKSAIGPAVPGAQVYVCTQPANTAAAPPSPLAAIYSDSGGLVPITQPIITDGFGHANFYALPGLYTVVVALNGVIQQVYPDQSLGGVGTSGGGGGGTGSGLLLETNGVANANQLILNLESTDGSLTIVNDSNGNSNLSANVSQTADMMLGPGIFTLAPLVGTLSGQFVNNGNDVVVFRFQTPYKLSFTALDMALRSNNVSGTNIQFGIYDLNGNRLWQSGVQFIPNTGTQVTYTITFPTAVNLPAGTYYFAWSADNTGTANMAGFTSINLFSYANSSSNSNVINFTRKTFAVAANPSSSSSGMPSTLGTITAVTSATIGNIVVPAPFFHN